MCCLSSFLAIQGSVQTNVMEMVNVRWGDVCVRWGSKALTAVGVLLESTVKQVSP